MSGSQSGGVVQTTLTIQDGEFRRSLEAAAQLINGHVRAVEQANRATAAMGQQADRAAGQNRNFGNILGQAGFQIQDFAGQVQAGTSALTALSQQGSQFLGVFGTGGAIAGAALTVGILATSLLTASSNAADLQKNGEAAFKAMAESGKQVAETTREIADLLATTEQRALAAANAQIEALRATARSNLDVSIQRQDDAAAGRVEALTELRKIAEAEAKVQENIARIRRSGATVSAQDEADLLRPYATRRFAAQSLLQGSDAVLGRMSDRITQLNEQVNQLAAITPAQIVAAQGSGRGGGGRAVDTVLRDAEALQSAFDRVFDGAETKAEERISRFADETSRASRNVDDLASVGREFATVFSSAFDGLITQGGKFSDVLDRLGLGLARILERQFITKPLESALTSSLGQGGFLRGIFDSAGSALSGLLGFRADGGPVSAGSPYIVGERGPELFVPNFSGTIVPNHAMGGGAVFNIDARGAEPGVEARIRAVLTQEAPKLSAYVRGDLAARVNRGGNDALTFGRRRSA